MNETIGAPFWMTLAVIFGFLLDWIAIIFEWKKIKPMAKVLAMTLVMVWTLFGAQAQGGYLLTLLLIAQAFGLLGDILLLLPGKWFIWGLGAFLVGHFFYLGLLFTSFGIAYQLGVLRGANWPVLIVGLILWVIYLFFFTRLFSPYINAGKSDRSFWAAVLFYGVTLSSLVVISAYSLFILPGFTWIRLCLPIGSLLFFVSDNILAYDRFVRKLRLGQLWVMVSYLSGQFGLAIGFVNILGYLSNLSH